MLNSQSTLTTLALCHTVSPFSPRTTSSFASSSDILIRQGIGGVAAAGALSQSGQVPTFSSAQGVQHCSTFVATRYAPAFSCNSAQPRAPRLPRVGSDLPPILFARQMKRRHQRALLISVNFRTSFVLSACCMGYRVAAKQSSIVDKGQLTV